MIASRWAGSSGASSGRITVIHTNPRQKLIAARMNPGWRMKCLIGCGAEAVVIVPSSGYRVSRYDRIQTTAVTQIFVTLQVVAAPIANVCVHGRRDVR